MKEGFRQSQAWLHNWLGILVGSILFMIFTFGTISFFKEELTQWMRPELANLVLPVSYDNEQLVNLAITNLQEKAPTATLWVINLPSQRDPTLQLTWFGKKQREKIYLDPHTGKTLTVRETIGGNFFYRMHYQLWYLSPLIGRIIVSVLTLAMLVSIITGIIVHKKIFKDFFTLRLKKGQRSWLDGHNFSAVVALPFHLMISFSGLLLLIVFFMPWGYKTVYQGNMGKLYQEMFNIPDFFRKPSNEYSALPKLPSYLKEFEQTFPNHPITQVAIYNPLNTNRQIAVSSMNEKNIVTLGLVFDNNGHIVSTIGAKQPAAKTLQLLNALHKGQFANYLLRWLYFFAGLAGCFMIASGLILWLNKRMIKLNHHTPVKLPLHYRFIQILNITSIAGLCLATPYLLIANRLLPAELSQRSLWEVRCFFFIWIIAFFYAASRPYKKAWLELSWLIAGSCLLVPISNACTTNMYFYAFQQKQWGLLMVDVSFALAGLFFIWLGYLLKNKKTSRNLVVHAKNAYPS